MPIHSRRREVIEPIESTLMLDSSSPEIPSVLVNEADKRVREGTVLIDVREQNEWDEARIAGAEFKPLSEANSWYEGLPSDQEIIFYCRSGQRSSQIVRALIDQAGMSNVTNMTGGIIAWAEAGLPLEE